MAKATVADLSRPPVTLELTGEEAVMLTSLLCNEKWPGNTKASDVLNGVFAALNDADVEIVDGSDYDRN